MRLPSVSELRAERGGCPTPGRLTEDEFNASPTLYRAWLPGTCSATSSAWTAWRSPTGLWTAPERGQPAGPVALTKELIRNETGRHAGSTPSYMATDAHFRPPSLRGRTRRARPP